MIITRKHLSRRTFLRGTAGLVGLPLLDAMVPALGWARGTRPAPPIRLCFVYVPNGMVMPSWTPASTGKDFAFTPILKPLEPFRDDTLVLSGLRDEMANALGDGGGDHARASASFLTGAHPRESGSDIHAGVSADQVATQAIGRQTRLASLELGLEDHRIVGLCDGNYSCAYTSCISWRTPTTPLPPVPNPRHVFDRLFGPADRPSDPAAAARRDRYRRSILDGAVEDARRLEADLGPPDRRKLDEYLTSVREVERGIQQAERDGPARRPGDPPPGIPADPTEHARLMFGLLALAFQADITRVATMMVGRESSIRSYDHLGLPESHHQLSHHKNDPATLAKLVKIQTYHAGLFADFVGKLKALPDGDGTLLDRCLVLYGAGIADSNRHTHDDLPVLLVGTGNGTVRSGRHLDCGKDTPVTNLLLTMLDRIGVRPGRLGDSTGPLEI
ncbi:MAG: DUF1552 domain-containing protein [Gemmataceae bacterium]|nr:DUF1552 domain-containing protein [Gemmataceae bacterium]